MMIVDIPEGLPVPMVSSPPTSVQEWNSDDKNFLAMVFDFGSSLVHDNGVLLLFYKDDHVEIPVEVQGQEPLEFLPHTEAIEEEPHPNDNAKHILELQEELHRARARIEE
jgi:hypothetical protein